MMSLKMSLIIISQKQNSKVPMIKSFSDQVYEMIILRVDNMNFETIFDFTEFLKKIILI